MTKKQINKNRSENESLLSLFSHLLNTLSCHVYIHFFSGYDFCRSIIPKTIQSIWVEESCVTPCDSMNAEMYLSDNELEKKVYDLRFLLQITVFY